jgi:hypothetical protein
MAPVVPSESLCAKRRVAVLAVARLLRVCAGHEPEEWLCYYKKLYDALQGERDEDAVQLNREFQTADSCAVPKWVASVRLAADVRKTIARLRTHMRYGDQRSPLTLDLDDPNIEAEGTREQQQERELARQGIHPGLPVIGLAVNQLLLALSVIESMESSVDKRVMSITVQKDGSLFVNTGEQ